MKKIETSEASGKKVDHKKQIDIKISNEILRKLEKDIEEFRTMEDSLVKSDLENQFNEKIIALEKKVDTFVNNLEKKDLVIKALEKKLNHPEEKNY